MSTDSLRPSDIKCSLAYWTHGVVGPYTLKAEQRLGVLVEFDRRLNRAARMVFRFIVSWDMESHGNALASARFISSALKAQDPAGGGLPRSTVNDALNLLCDTGWLEQVSRGTGPKNASRYQPAWHALEMATAGEFPSIVANRPISPDAFEPSDFPGRYRPIFPDASTENRPIFPDKDSLTSDARTDARTESEIYCAAPSAPPAPPAYAADAAGTAQDEGEPTFESLWRAYAHNRGKKEARAVWNALPPEVDRAAVIEAAIAWRASWAAQGKPDAPRFTLARWLRDERYDEDAPRGFQKPEKASKAKSRPATAASQREPITVRIVSADLSEVDGIAEIRFTASDAAGTMTSHSIIIEHPNEDTQVSGQKHLANLVHAAGLENILDTSELVGRSVVILPGEKRFNAPDHRPDDEPPLPERPEPPKYANRAGTVREERPDFGTDKWQRRKTEQYRRDAAVREWDKEHPELFQDDDEAPVEHSGEPIKIDFETWRQHAGLSVDEAEAVLTGEGE